MPNNSVAPDDNVHRYNTKACIEKPKHTNTHWVFDQQPTLVEQRTCLQCLSEIRYSKSNSDSSDCDHLVKGYRSQEQYNILDKLIIHQNQAKLPQRQMFTFVGEVTEYRPFILVFEAIIEAKELCDASRLHHLEQFTTSHMKELVRSSTYGTSQKWFKSKIPTRGKIRTRIQNSNGSCWKAYCIDN